ncbi:MAG: hypothetical protein GX304_01075 [Clostridiales bacterium]|nr:hypothetical protein [Clostridiales bacterium]
MRFKLISVILVLLMTASIIYGCGLISINREKDYNQVIAMVGDEVYKDEILKKDLVQAYLSQGSYYMQNYGLSSKETFEYLFEQLINNRIMVQEAAKELIRIKGKEGTIADYLTKDPQTGKKYDSMKKLVGDDAYAQALSAVYKYEKEMLDYYEEQVKKENPTPTPSGTPEPTPTPTPTPRPTRKPDIEPTETPFSPEPSPSEGTRYTARQRMLDAIKRQKNKKDAEEAYKEFFEETLVAQLENQILRQYQEYLESGISINFEDLELRYKNMYQQDKHQLTIDLSAYDTRLENAGENSFVLYNPLEGYGYVKNLLIGFGDKLEKELADYQSMEWSKSEYYKMRSVLLCKIEVKDLREGIEDSDRENYPDIFQFFDAKIKTMGGAKVEDPKYEINGEYYFYDNTTLTEENKDCFIDLIFQYGTDPGMFNNAVDYLSMPKPAPGGSEKFVKEFAEAARDVVEKGEGSYVLVGTDYGWHIILCTDVIAKGESDELEESVVDTINQKIAEGIKFDEIEKSIRETFTYKLYRAMRYEIKNSIFNETVEDILDMYKGEDSNKVVKYMDRIADLLAIQ